MKAKAAINKKDIAIVGMAGKFPQAANIKEFWNQIIQGKEMTHFYSPEELSKAGIPEAQLKDPNYIPVGSFVDQPESFDYAFFGYTRDEAAHMDPQIRIMHEQVWLALEDAGHNSEIDKRKIGLYLAAGDNVNWRAHVMLSNNQRVSNFYQKQLSNSKFISTLIAYNMDFRGPSIFLDSACSSSLLAIHLACRNIWLKECQIAVAGGVRISTNTDKGYFFQPGHILSSDGHCKPFSAEATGTIGGDGAGVVVLKRLEDALQDADHIYAVIRSSAINNDGRGKIGYTAPSVTGQSDCIRMAHQMAGISSDSISYIETHGTGTRLGDPIEIEALNKAFGYNAAHRCAIGSVKSNLGHLDAAAGVTGLIKTSLALEQQQLPPSLHYQNPNPEINFAAGPFYVNTKAQPWPIENKPFRAGVSSFGIGGTNAHIILEEAPARLANTLPNPYELIVCSAKTEKALQRIEQRLKNFVDQEENLNLANLAYSLNHGRQGFKYRKSYVAKDGTDLKHKLNQSGKFVARAKDKPQLVFLFPGQGNQYYKMAEEVYETEPVFREIMDAGFELLQKETGRDYKSIIGYGSKATSSAEINETLHTQPLLFLVEYALANLLINIGLEPSVMIGHSLGEFVAACISGVFPFSEGLKIIIKRAELMHNAEKGAMLSVAASAKEIEPILPEEISIAVINTAQSCVVSGEVAIIEDFIKFLKEREIVNIRLKTSHAFHSEMMEGAQVSFAQALTGQKWQAPTIPFISNLTGKEITKAENISADYWARHLRHTVNFLDGLDNLLQKQNLLLIEVGPGRSLSKMVQQHQLYKSESPVVNMMRHPKENWNDQEYLLNAFGQLWCQGAPLNWSKYYGDGKRQKIVAPGYAFEYTQLPTLVDPFARLQGISSATEDFSEKNIDLTIAPEETIAQEDLGMERPMLTVDYVEMETELEKEMVVIWQAFLGYEKVGALDNFFELGGDSLKAMSLLKEIHKAFNVEIALPDFFEKSTIKKLAAEIELARQVAKLQQPTLKKNTIKI